MAKPIRYTQCDWGDLIEGTKQHLQALGLGVGAAFPGEPGGPSRKLAVRDPRGFEAIISNCYTEAGRFTAYLKFPGWPERPPWTSEWGPAFPGVKKRCSIWYDEYHGSGNDLEAAGLVRCHQLPGMPGMRKTRVTIYADGSLPAGPVNASSSRSREPGARWIERASKTSYRVYVVASPQEEQQRRAARDAEETQWLELVRSLPRPARLQPIGAAGETELSPEARGAMMVSLGSAFIKGYEASPARLDVGEQVIYWDGIKQYPVEIIEAYSEYSVRGNGRRLGYVVRDNDGERFFAPAHRLLGPDRRIRHLVLTHVRGTFKPRPTDGRWL